MDALTDPAALGGFCRGEPEAVAEVVNACYPFLLNFLIRIGCPRCDAEDIIQESLLKAQRSLREHAPPRAALVRAQPAVSRPWLYKIALNTFRDHQKRSWRRREIPFVAVGTDLCTSPGSGPEESAVRRDAEDRVRSAVMSLPEPQRICLVLRYYHDFTLEEVAAAAGCPVGTAKSRLHSALGRLRGALAGVVE